MLVLGTERFPRGERCQRFRPCRQNPRIRPNCQTGLYISLCSLYRYIYILYLNICLSHSLFLSVSACLSLSHSLFLSVSLYVSGCPSLYLSVCLSFRTLGCTAVNSPCLIVLSVKIDIWTIYMYMLLSIQNIIDFRTLRRRFCWFETRSPAFSPSSIGGPAVILATPAGTNSARRTENFGGNSCWAKERLKIVKHRDIFSRIRGKVQCISSRPLGMWSFFNLSIYQSYRPATNYVVKHLQKSNKKFGTFYL